MGLYSRKDRFIILQKWEAVVLEISKTWFVARLKDLTTNESEETAEFDVEEVGLADRVLVQRGAIFYWTIGYHENEARTRETVSRIRFRRVPKWTQGELDEAKRDAKELASDLGWR
jgi:hypothetical protein